MTLPPEMVLSHEDPNRHVPAFEIDLARENAIRASETKLREEYKAGYDVIEKRLGAIEKAGEAQAAGTQNLSGRVGNLEAGQVEINRKLDEVLNRLPCVEGEVEAAEIATADAVELAKTVRLWMRIMGQFGRFCNKNWRAILAVIGFFLGIIPAAHFIAWVGGAPLQAWVRQCIEYGWGKVR